MKRIIALLLFAFPTFAQTGTQHDRIDARGQVKTDKYVNRAVVVITGATPDVSTGNVFKTNNGGTTTITNFLNPADTQRIIIICGDGNTTIQNNTNIVTSSGSNFGCGVNQSIEFTYDAAQGKWVQSGSVNGGGGGGSPGGSTNDIQKKSGGGAFVAASETDDGTTFRVKIDSQFHGPNPNYDLREFGGYASASTPPSTTGSIASGQTTLTLASAQDFANGQGIVVHKAGPAPTITTPGTPTVTPINITGGVTTYTYQTLAEQRNGALTAATTSASTSNGRSALGATVLTLTTCVRVSGVSTYTSSSPHNLVAGTQVQINGYTTAPFNICNGVKTIASTPTGTTFTTNDGFGVGDETNNSGGTVTVFACNKLDFPAGTYSGANTIRYWHYRNGALAGVSQGVDPFWIDCGLPTPTAPAYIPSSPPGATQPGYLATTIVSGGGTTTLTLANAAGTTATTQTVLHDNSTPLLACAQAAFANQSGGGACYIPNPNVASNSWVFNGTTDFNTLTRGTVAMRIHLAGNVTLNQSWVLANNMDLEGEPRAGTSFDYLPGSLIGGGAYPQLYAPVINSLHLTRLLVSASFSQQTGFLSDQNSTTGGSVGVISDDVAYNGSGGNNTPVILKSGFDYYFYRGVITNNGSSFGPMPSFLSTITSPAVVGNITTNLLIYRMKIEQTEFDHRGIVYDCAPMGGQNFFSHGHEFRNILYESMTTPFLRINCSAGSSFSTMTLVNVDMADSLVGFGTPMVDTVRNTYIAFDRPGISSGPNGSPLFIGKDSSNGISILNSGATNRGNASYFEALNGGAYTTGTLGTSATGRFFTTFAGTPPLPNLVLSAGGNVPVGVHTYQVSCWDVENNESLMGPGANITTTPGNQTVTITVPTLPVGCVGWSAYRDTFRDNATGGPVAPTFVAVDTYSFTHGDSNPTSNNAAVFIADATRVAAPLLQHIDTSGFTVSTGVPAPLTANRTFRFPDATGTACVSTLCAVNAVTINGDAALSASPRSIPPVFLPGALTSTWTGASWTLDKAITVTRVQTAAKFVPAGCSTSAIIRLTDGVTPVNLTVNAATNDSGVISQNYAAGATLTVSVQTAAAGCTASPGDVNVLIQQRMQ